MVPRPTVMGVSLCEKAVVERETNNVSLVSTFTKMAVKQLPAIALPFAVCAVFADGAGDATISIVIHRLDTLEEIYSQSVLIHFPNRLTEVQFIYRVNACSFPSEGRYQVTLLIDGEWIAQRPLNIQMSGTQP